MADHHARALRASRADPPTRARADASRRRTYTAALQQFEELLAAARVVGPASRPLPLFYALSQAGRAIVAAYGEEPDITAHGLVEDRSVQPTDLLHRRVKRSRKKDGTDAFGAVAAATGSPDLGKTVELGALWAALPSVYRLPPDSWKQEWRLALDVDTGTLARRSDDGSAVVNVLVSSLGGNPLVAGLDVLSGRRYPTLATGTRAWLRGGSEVEPGGWFADLEIPLGGEDEEVVLDRAAPWVYDRSGRALIPILPGETAALSPLMLWWALLFALSVVARYHPGPWTRALAVEGSKQAVPLEALLEKALEVLPVLVYEAVFLHPDFS